MANNHLDRPLGVLDRQEDSRHTYFTHEDLTLPVFLPHLRLPHPTTTLDPHARPLWTADSPPPRLDPTRPPYPGHLYPYFSPLDDLASPVSLLPGSPFANIHLASSAHEPFADGYLALHHDGPFDAGHGPHSRQPSHPAFAPVGSTLPHPEAATAPSIPSPPRHRPSLPSFFETALCPADTYSTHHTTPHTMSGRKRNSGVVDVPSSSPSAPAPKRRRRSVPSSDPLERESEDETDIIDLRDMSKVPEMLLQRQKEKEERVRLGSFQCAICMDYATTLTVTHCGHLFCAECLSQALQTEAQRHKCPMCRQKIESKPREAYKNTTKGFWPLELKLMTAKKKEKKSDG